MLLEINNLNVHYGRLWVLHNVALQVDRGETVAIVGPNGAGKSTLAYSVTRLIDATTGDLKFDGQDVFKTRPQEMVRRGLALVPEGRRIFPFLSVLDNLQLGAYTPKARVVKEASLERVFAYFPVLKDRMNQAGGTLSGGEQEMLAIARALMSLPRLLILDEPSTGLAIMVIDKVYEVVKRICQEEGVGIVIIEQNVQKALELADRAYVLEGGAIALEGKAKDVLADNRLRNAYLGLS